MKGWRITLNHGLQIDLFFPPGKSQWAKFSSASSLGNYDPKGTRNNNSNEISLHIEDLCEPGILIAT